MNYINFSEANCKNCYKCLRSCPVKAIKFKNEQAEIIEDKCIACGHCLEICPQNARNIKSDLRIVKSAIASGRKVVASIAPSFAGVFHDIEEGKLVAALKRLGFSYVEETALGAEVVSELYNQYVDKSNLGNLITTCCPSANFLIEKYYPQLIPYMIPIVSPMLAHGKLLKRFYGNDSFVVFIGPCVAKKFEAGDAQHRGTIDAVITYDELKTWFEDKRINFSTLKGKDFDRESFRKGCSFPISGGVLEGLKDKACEDGTLEMLSVTGIEESIEVLHSIAKGEITGICLELSSCKGSCIGGPSMVREEKGFYTRRQKVKEYISRRATSSYRDQCINSMLLDGQRIKKKRINPEISITTDEDSSDEVIKNINFSKIFIDKTIKKKEPSEIELKEILHHMGKYEDRDELNCGVCGYNTCREKANAIFNGMAETNMCLHYMRTKAESMTNIIFESTPNCVILLDENMKVIEFNPAAENTFLIKADKIKGKPISMLIDDSDFLMVKKTKESIRGKKVAYPQYNVVFIQNIVYLEKQDILLIIMADVMAEEKNRREILRIRENTINAAQKVVEKQMRVAQEIASLLGETTAETKMTLVNLKKILMGEDGDVR